MTPDPTPGPAAAPWRRWWPLPGWLRSALAAALLVAAVWLAFREVETVGVIVFDDGAYLTRNPRVLSGLTRQGLAWAFSWGDGRDTYFHPVTWLSLMTDLELFGFRPELMHLENLALHAVTALLLFSTALAATGRRGPSLLAALLFALHPLTVEAVAWLTERKTVLATALAMGAVRLWVAHLARPARWRVAAAAALYLLSLLARPQLLVLPALLLALDLWPLGRVAPLAAPGGRFAPAPPRRLLLEKWPFVAASALVTGLVLLSLPGVATTDIRPPPLGYRLAQAVASLADYAAAVAWPRDLVILRDLPEEVGAGAFALGAAVLLGLTAAAAWQARRRPWWLAGWLWFLAALFPALGLVQNGVWPAWADRFAYAPLLGLSLAAAFGAAEAWERWPRARLPLLAGAAAAVLALGLATRAQVADWQSSETLMRRAAERQPWSPLLLAFHGSALMNEGRIEEARGRFEAALRLKPDHVLSLMRLGELDQREGRPEAAAERFRRVIRLRPALPDAHFALGMLAADQGWADEARRHLRQYVALAPVGSGGSLKAARARLRQLGDPAP